MTQGSGAASSTQRIGGLQSEAIMDDLKNILGGKAPISTRLASQPAPAPAETALPAPQTAGNGRIRVEA